MFDLYYRDPTVDEFLVWNKYFYWILDEKAMETYFLKNTVFSNNWIIIVIAQWANATWISLITNVKEAFINI